MSILPENFRHHYQKILGETQSQKFFEYCQKPLKKSIRVNTLKYSIEQFKAESKDRNWTITPIPWCTEGFYIERTLEDRKALGTYMMHTAGGVYLQEASSMLPVTALFHGHTTENFSEKIFCDVASAPGSKTTQIAAKMNNQGLLIANEISSSRLKALYSNIERCGISNVILTNYEGENLCSLLPNSIDFLLLDAPCTGEGTVRKDRNALKNWQPHDAVTISHLQKKLIVSAFNALKPGGEMVYSTCTLAREENQDVVTHLQKNFPDAVEIISLQNLFAGSEKSVTPEGFLHIYPQIYDSEGFFVAKIRKKSITSNSLNNRSRSGVEGTEKVFHKNTKKPPYQKLSRKKSAELEKFFLDQWGYTFRDTKNFWQKENTLWLFPTRSEEIFSSIKGDRIGIPLVTMHKKGWKTHHEAAIALGKCFSKNSFEVTQESISKIFKGEDLPLNILYPCKGGMDEVGSQTLVTFKNFPLALGKIMNNKWKNNLPRVLVREGVQW